MDGRHDFILSTVADKVGMSLEEAEDFVLEGNQVKRQLFSTRVQFQSVRYTLASNSYSSLKNLTDSLQLMAKFL